LQRETTTDEVKGWNTASLWCGILVPPLSFGTDEVLSYAVVGHACSTGHFYVLHIISAVAVISCLFAGLLAWHDYLRVPQSVDDEGGSPIARARFMAMLGLTSALLFTIAIIAEAVPRFILSPCD
jgi:hypothetical protein